MLVSELVSNLKKTINNLEKLPQESEVRTTVDQGGYCESYLSLYVGFEHEIDQDEDLVYFTILLEEKVEDRK